MSFKILSLDGGGIRGLITAIWLHKLETELNRPLAECFDLIAGTSTGSILACALAAKIPTEQIVMLYREKASVIFPPEQAKEIGTITSIKWLDRLLWRTQIWLGQKFKIKFDGVGLNQVLEETLGTSSFGKLSTDTMVTSYDIKTREAVILKSFRTAYSDTPLWEICRASCAAPTYFPAHSICEHTLIDGGIVANNPSMIAIAEALSRDVETADLLLASFGTGRSFAPLPEYLASGAAIDWLIPPGTPIVDTLFDGSVSATNYIARQIIPESNFYRFQVELGPDNMPIDNVAPAFLQRIEKLATDYLLEDPGVSQMTRLIQALR